jgi:hypothetical protein
MQLLSADALEMQLPSADALEMQPPARRGTRARVEEHCRQVKIEQFIGCNYIRGRGLGSAVQPFGCKKRNNTEYWFTMIFNTIATAVVDYYWKSVCKLSLDMQQKSKNRTQLKGCICSLRPPQIN